MIFFLLSMLCVYLGFQSIAKKGKYFSFFFVFVLVFPSPSFAEKILSVSSIYYLDFFVAGMGLASIFYRQVPVPLDGRLLFGVFCILLIGLLNYYAFNATFLRDLKVYLFLLVMIAYLPVIQARAQSLAWDSVRFFLLVNLTLDILAFFYLRQFGIPSWVSNDLFFTAEGIFEARYSDFGTILSLFILVKIFVDKIKDPVSVACCFITMAVSGNRTLLMFACGLVALWLLRSGRSGAVGLVLGVLVFIPFVGMVMDGRASSVDSLDSLYDFFERRYLPAFMLMDLSSIKFILFGNGMGTEFFIPWFEFRDVRPYSALVDGLFPTLFAKFGLLCVPLLWFFFQYLRMGVKNTVAYFFVSLAFIFMSLTTAPFYQVSFLLYLLVPAFYFIMCTPKVGGSAVTVSRVRG